MTLAVNPAVSPTPFPHRCTRAVSLGVRLAGAQGSLYAEASGIGEGGEVPGTGLANCEQLALGNGLRADWHRQCLLASLPPRFRPPESQLPPRLLPKGTPVSKAQVRAAAVPPPEETLLSSQSLA